MPPESLAGRPHFRNVLEHVRHTGAYAVPDATPEQFVSLQDSIGLSRAVVVHAVASGRDNRRTLVFVFEGEGDKGRAKWRYVTPGRSNDTHVEIVENPDTEMLAPGEIVLVSGHYTLSHDIPVRLVDNVAKAEGARPR